MNTFANALRLGFYKDKSYLIDFLEKEELPEILTTSQVVTMLKVLLPLEDPKWTLYLQDLLTHKNINHWYDVNVSVYVLEKMNELGVSHFSSLEAFHQSNQKNEIVFQHIKQAKNKKTFIFYYHINAFDDPYLQLKILSLYRIKDEMTNVLIKNVVDKLKTGGSMASVDFEMSLAWASLVKSIMIDMEHPVYEESEIFFE